MKYREDTVQYHHSPYIFFMGNQLRCPYFCHAGVGVQGTWRYCKALGSLLALFINLLDKKKGCVATHPFKFMQQAFGYFSTFLPFTT